MCSFVALGQIGRIPGCHVQVCQTRTLGDHDFVFSRTGWPPTPINGRPIRLDGVDWPIIAPRGSVDAGERERLQLGTRVQPRWASETKGHIRDIECFELSTGETRG